MSVIVCPKCSTQLQLPTGAEHDHGLVFDARCVCGAVFRLQLGTPAELQPATPAQRPQQPQQQSAVQPPTTNNNGDIEDAAAAPPGAAPAPTTSVNFTVNGLPYSASDFDATMTLNDWLRYTGGFTDVKRMCLQGGCGACVVMYSDATADVAINSCLRPLATCDGAAITTCTGIGNSKIGYHPIQERLADNSGSQCGMCSTGHVMTMYGLLANNPLPTQQDIENVFDGNICRCTGYRPILQAMKSFAVDFDASAKPPPPPDASLCTGTCGTCPVDCGRHESTAADNTLVTTSARILQLKEYAPFDPATQIRKPTTATPRPFKLTTSTGAVWYKVTSLTDVFTVLAASPTTTKLVVGNTSTGIYPDVGIDTYIDVRDVTQLTGVTATSSSITVGAAVSINDLMATLVQYESSSTAFPHLLAHMQKVANDPVRNIACWVGNFMITVDNADFPSDLFTIFSAVGATVTVYSSASQSSTMGVMDLLTTDMTGCVVQSMTIPFSQSGDVYRSYKVMQRHENSHAYVNAAFLGNVDSSSNTLTAVPTIIYGGVGPHAVAAPNTAAYLGSGVDLTLASTLQTALTTLTGELTPDAPPGNVAYRSALIPNLFYKWYLNLVPSLVTPETASAATPFVRPVSTAVESWQTVLGEAPVSEPLPKMTALQQTSGEANYTDDISPSAPGGFFGAFVTATSATGMLTGIDASAALAAEGVVRFVSAADIPGENLFAGGNQVFVPIGSNVTYYGQAIGIVVADTQAHANAAAMLVTSSYSGATTPILTIDDAVAANSFWEPQANQPIVQGDVATAWAQCDNVVEGTINMQSAYHFYMETQVSVAVPTEEGGMQMYTATQGPVSVQANVASVLGITNNKVNVEIKRVGGAYGGKHVPANQIAAGTAVAAWVLNKPVKCQLTIETNMAMCGKRVPYQANYKIGFNNDGTIIANQVTFYQDCGSANNQNPMPLYFFDNCYNIANWDVTPLAVRTNTAGNCSMRAPGALEAITWMEQEIEHVAVTLGMQAEEVRLANFYVQNDITPYGQPLPWCQITSIFNQLKTSCDFDARYAAVQAYNTANSWTKQGISLVPIKYGIGYGGAQFGVNVHVEMADGSVVISNSGIEMGQGINTKVAQCAAYELGISMSNIQVVPTTTNTIPNSTHTGGSIGTGRACTAVILACQELNSRLATVKKATGASDWLTVVQAAYNAGVDLSVNGWDYTPNPANDAPYEYCTYGASCVQSQIDVLTGEVQVLRADILMDLGISLNPAVDIGQVEGCFVMGLGWFLTEQIEYDSTTGALTSNSTWTYKPPCSKDIPIDFRVSLLRNTSNPAPTAPLGSKACGEPPMMSSIAVFLSVKEAIRAARADAGSPGYFELDVPATPDAIQQACLLGFSQLTV